mmetsp:Transcript_15443/g.29719  ORF Transcript_15443/g.29719 Transcript_15443/m.29719 type:complete len:200 (-) Transcript_15443:829-1428(-)
MMAPPIIRLNDRPRKADAVVISAPNLLSLSRSCDAAGDTGSQHSTDSPWEFRSTTKPAGQQSQLSMLQAEVRHFESHFRSPCTCTASLHKDSGLEASSKQVFSRGHVLMGLPCSVSKETHPSAQHKPCSQASCSYASFPGQHCRFTTCPCVQVGIGCCCDKGSDVDSDSLFGLYQPYTKGHCIRLGSLPLHCTLPKNVE